MKTHFLKSLIIFVVILTNTVFAAKSDAVVKIICKEKNGGIITGSGVCVSDDGVILTVTHVANKGTCEVYFRHAKYSVIYSSIPSKEGIAILKVKSNNPLPFLRISDVVPKRGETVWVMGYPKGQWKSFPTIVTTKNIWFADDPKTHLIGVVDPAIPGTSGGPLVTKDWEIVGICSVSDKIAIPLRIRRLNPKNYARVSGQTSNTGAMFISLPHIKTAYAEFMSKKTEKVHKRPIVYVYLDPVQNRCLACERFKSDWQKGNFSSYDIRPVYGKSNWYKISGSQFSDYPQFYAQGTSENLVKVGYDDAPGLLQMLASIFKGVAGLIFNPKAEPEGSPFGQNQPQEGANPPEPPPFESAPVPKEKSNQELQDIQSNLSNILQDIKILKDGSVFQKIPAMLSLKKDVANLKSDGKNVLSKIDEAKAELDTIRDIAKQDIIGLKSAIGVMKDEKSSKLQKAIALAPAVKKAVNDAKYLKDWLGDPKSSINALFLLLGGLLGSIKGYKNVKG